MINIIIAIIGILLGFGLAITFRILLDKKNSKLCNYNEDNKNLFTINNYIW